MTWTSYASMKLTGLVLASYQGRIRDQRQVVADTGPVAAVVSPMPQTSPSTSRLQTPSALLLACNRGEKYDIYNIEQKSRKEAEGGKKRDNIWWRLTCGTQLKFVISFQWYFHTIRQET
jgi:hypothetical protein